MEDAPAEQPQNGHVEPTPWPTKEDAAKALGVAVRTLDRRINELGIKTGLFPALGRKPIPTIDPEGFRLLQELKDKTSTALVKEPPRQLPRRYQDDTVKTVATLTSHVMQTDVMTTLGQRLDVMVSLLSGPKYVDLREAEQLTGLPASHLRKAQFQGRRLGVVVSRKLRFLVDDLMSYRVA